MDEKKTPQKRILVVDDDFEQQDLYTQLFVANGYEVVTGFDGLDGLEKALKFRPDLIFTGIIMPRMDGFELIRNIRNNVSMATLPVIMFSHLGREEDKKKASRFFNVSFMVKGYNTPKEILEKVKNLLAEAEKPPGLRQENPDTDDRLAGNML